MDIALIHNGLSDEKPDIGLIHRLVSDVVMELYRSNEISFVDPPSYPGIEDKMYEAVVNYTHSVPDIAAICKDLHTDRFNISKAFSRQYGLTPYAFHKRFRIIGATKRILVEGSDIMTAAKGAGYIKEGKFAEAFRKEFGCNPSQFIPMFKETVLEPKPIRPDLIE